MTSSSDCSLITPSPPKIEDALFGGTAAKREGGRGAAGVPAAAAAAAAVTAATVEDELLRPLRSAGVPVERRLGSALRSTDDGLAVKPSSEASSDAAVGGGAEGTTFRRLGLESAFERSARSTTRSSSPNAEEIGGVSKSEAAARTAAPFGAELTEAAADAAGTLTAG